MAVLQSLHIFCRVVDNFGDIGVCWRLTRQLVDEHGLSVTLWVDDLDSFHRICPAIDNAAQEQQVSGVTVKHWHANAASGEPLDPDLVADIVIEAFGCDLPEPYIAAMAARAVRPVWINLEYLSAEAWVETSHGMPSHYPALPLIKHFYFPGFTDKTGGLLRERDLLAQRHAFQRSPQALTDFLRGIGVTPVSGEILISLFCYPTAPVTALLDALQAASSPSLCLVPEGVAPDALRDFMQAAPTVGATACRGNLRVQVVPFMEQADYDRLLWCCDVNFVRGEDSMVRAQWAGRPFVWQPYPQQESAHQIKLEAFLQRYIANLADGVAAPVQALWRQWNADVHDEVSWNAFRAVLPGLQSHQAAWIDQLVRNGDLVSNLMRFVRKLG